MVEILAIYRSKWLSNNEEKLEIELSTAYALSSGAVTTHKTEATSFLAWL